MHIDIDIHNNPDLLEILVLELISPRFNWCICANVNIGNPRWENLPEKTPRFFRLQLDHHFIQWQCHDMVGHYLYGDATSIKCTRDLADLLNFLEQTVELFPACTADGYSFPISFDPADPTSAQQAKEAFDKAYLVSLLMKQTVPAVWYYPATIPFKKIIIDPPYQCDHYEFAATSYPVAKKKSKLKMDKLAAKLDALKALAENHITPVITAQQKPKLTNLIDFSIDFSGWCADPLAFSDSEMKKQTDKELADLMQKYLANHMDKLLAEGKKYLT